MPEENPGSTEREEVKASPKRGASLGIQGRLVVLVLLALIPILLFQAYFFHNQYDYRKGVEIQANLEVARALAKAFDAFVADVLRQELAIGIAATASPPFTPPDFTRILVESVNDYSATVRAFSWVSPQGRILASSNPDAIGVDLSDRAYFKEIASGREWLVTDLLDSRLKGEEGEPIFGIVRSFRDEEGNLLGIAFASVVPANLDKILAIERSRGAGVSLVDSKGIHVRRYPVVDLTSEQRNWLKLYPAMEDALEGKEVSATLPAPVSGKMRLAGFTPISTTGWVAAASRDEGEVVGPIISAILKQTALLSLVALASLGAALRLARTVSISAATLQKHALSLAHGEVETPVTVSGPSEFQDVARAFNEMAGKVHSREEALRISEERFRAFMDNSPAIAWAKDEAGRYVYLNRTFEKRFGARLEEWRGKTDLDLWPQETADEFRRSDAEAFSLGHAIEVTEQAPTPEGNVTTWWSFKFPFHDASGKSYVGGIGVDVTELRRTEDALRKSEDRYRDLVENSQDLICTHDLNGTILSINPRPAQLLGYSPKELLGMSIRDILVPEIRHVFENYLDEIKRNRTARGHMYVQTKRGEQRVWEYNNTLRTEGVREAIVRGMAHDVTEQKRAQEALKRSRDELDLRVQERTAELTRANTALKESEKQLKILSSRLLSAQEDERSRVACEIHDSVGQSLHAIKSGMKDLQQQMREILGAPELEHALEDLMRVVDYSIEELRAVYMDLRPLILDDLGILATVNWFLRECRKTYPEITIESEIGTREEDVPEPLKIVIFRLLQAAMDNITRHSRAERACISLEKVDGRVELRVEDNGVGFSLEDVRLEKRPGGALGIAIMQERVESSGGIFTIRSSKGHGTTIRTFWDLGRFA